MTVEFPRLRRRELWDSETERIVTLIVTDSLSASVIFKGNRICEPTLALAFLAFTLGAAGWVVAIGMTVNAGVGDSVATGVWVADGVGLGVGVSVGAGVGVSVGVLVGVGVAVGAIKLRPTSAETAELDKVPCSTVTRIFVVELPKPNTVSAPAHVKDCPLPETIRPE